MHRLVEAGSTPARVFRAAALSNAQALGLASEIGTVQVGKRANLSLPRENPAETIEGYDGIVKGILRGRVLDREDLAATRTAPRIGKYEPSTEFTLLGAAYIGTMRAFISGVGDGEEEASGNSSVVERGHEEFKDSGESEALGASGGEEAASDARRGGTESHETWRKFSLNQSETAVDGNRLDR
jgi:Amidohydrolase family